MEKEYQSLITTTNDNNIGLAIQQLVEDNIKNINSCFVAKIQSINGNKVSIVQAIKRKSTDKDTIYNNCLVGFNQSGFWQTQFKLKVGDIGIAIVSQDDITSYKNNGKDGLNQTGRVQDKNDSIFLPMSLFDTLSNDDVNFIIKSLDNKCKLEFTNNNIGIFQANLLSLKSENTSLKTKLNELATILTSAMVLQSPSGTQPFDSATIASFNSWKTSLDELFKE